MVRRSLRIGIRLGLLGGLAFVLFKIVQSRRTAPDLPGSDDGWPQAPSVDVETEVAPGPAEPFAMVPAGDSGHAPDAPPAPVEEPARPAKTRPAKARPAKARPAKAVGPSPAAEAAARAAAESAAKKAVAKAVKAKAGASKATAKAAAKVVGPAKKARAVPAPAEQAAGTTWVPAQEGACPSSHPIKAKLASRIFHLPGMAAYQRTAADRCYGDEASAEADGLRKAKR